MYGNKLQSAAVSDYQNIDERDAKQSDGPYQCFCEQELSKDYQKAISDSYGHPDGTEICGVYNNLKSKKHLYSKLLEVVIVGFNIILRKMCLALVEILDYP